LLSEKQILNIEGALKHLTGWTGKFGLEDVGATVYSYSMLEIFDSLMHKFYPENKDSRLKIADNYEFVNFFQKLIADVLANPLETRYNIFCEGAHQNYPR